MAIGVIAGTLVLGLFLYSRRKQKDPDQDFHPDQDFPAEAPPNLHEMEDSWNLKTRPDMIQDAAQSVPLVEAPA